MDQNSETTTSQMAGKIAAEKPEITVIVPVYKVEKYLNECLDSIEAQSFKNWECILVDDGSPDGCPAICDDYAARDSRFKVIHKPNGGLSSARNAALAIARGKFISFIDSDDAVEPDFLLTMYETMTSTGADVVQVGYDKWFTSYRQSQHDVMQRIELDRRGVVSELMHNKKIPSYVCTKMFRREVIDPLFQEGTTFEDIYALTRWARNINKMILLPDNLYLYRQRDGSIINSNYIHNRMEFLKSIPDRLTLLRQVEPDAIPQTLADNMLWKGLINSAKIIVRQARKEQECNDAIQEINTVARMFKLPSIRSLGLKRWIRAWLLRNHPGAFISYMELFYHFHYRAHHNHNHLFE